MKGLGFLFKTALEIRSVLEKINKAILPINHESPCCKSESREPQVNAISSFRFQTDVSILTKKAGTAAAFYAAKHHFLLQSIIEVRIRNAKIHLMSYYSNYYQTIFTDAKELHLEGSNPILGRRLRQK